MRRCRWVTETLQRLETHSNSKEENSKVRQMQKVNKHKNKGLYTERHNKDVGTTHSHTKEKHEMQDDLKDIKKCKRWKTSRNRR